jgi:RNA polymerase sigma-70 factor (ECF subfamily)
MDTQQQLEIVRVCQKGDMSQFGELYDFYIRRIYDFIFYKILHKETAEDLTSQTFLKVVQHIHSFNSSQGSFSGWIFRIAHNTVIDHYRTKKESVGIDPEWDFASKENIEREFAAKEHLQGVFQYLQKLEPEQRDLIVMRIWNELSYKEISEITGKTEDALKMSFSRLMSKMRTDLPTETILLIFFLYKYFL